MGHFLRTCPHLACPLENKLVVCEFVLGDLQSGQDPGDGYGCCALMERERDDRQDQPPGFFSIFI